jgi:hypothetical protein
MSLSKPPGGRTPEQVEMDRIVELPMQSMPDEEEVEIFSFSNMLAGAFDSGERLWATQVAAVREYQKVGGGIFPVGVGWGKTGIALMIAEAAYQKGLRKIVLLLPPQLVPGLQKRHIPEWRRRVPFSLPIYFLSGRPQAARKSIVDSQARGLYVYPYSLLSATDAVELLETIHPELVIADEVHNLKNPDAARTKRLMHFMRTLKPKPELVGMSGSITDKNVSDYHHLATAALGENSPMPRSGSMMWSWGQILNANAGEPAGHAMKLMLPLITWAKVKFPDERFRIDQTESFRRAYRHRLESAPGVVVTSDQDIGISLRLENIEPPHPGKKLVELMRQVEEDMITPQGEPIDHALHTYKWRYELSMGFYNALVWPTEEHLMRYRKISQPEAELLLLRARMHHGCLKGYHSVLGEFFKHSPIGLDTPREVGLSCSRHGDKYVGASVYGAWRAVKDADFEGRPERYDEPVRVDDYKIREVVRWAKEHEDGGLIWVFHKEAGIWLMEALADAQVDAVHCPAGADNEIEEIGDPGRGGKGDRIVVASMASHGTGRNLQAFRNQLYAQWPRSPVLAEQTLGRLHRNGQKADELVAHTLLGPMFDHVCRAATLSDAIYISQTTGQKQKVVYCDYDPMPQIYSPEFLREQGMSPEQLTPEQRKVLASLFGPVME